jgi:hypothetical protein
MASCEFLSWRTLSISILAAADLHQKAASAESLVRERSLEKGHIPAARHLRYLLVAEGGVAGGLVVAEALVGRQCQ